MHGSRDVDERGTGNNTAWQGPIGVVPATESGPIKCGLGYTPGTEDTARRERPDPADAHQGRDRAGVQPSGPAERVESGFGGIDPRAGQ